MSTSSNIFASNVFYSGNVFGPSGEQLTQGAALTQKIQDLAGGFSNGIPGYVTSSSIVGTGVAQSILNPFGQGSLEGSIYFPGTTSNYLSTGGGGSSITVVNWSTVSGGFTLELWANFPSFVNASTDATSFPVMIGNMNNPSMGGPAYYWGFGPTTSGTLYFSYYNGSSIQVSSGTTLSTNTWYHLCVQSNGTNIFQFVNGTLASTTAISGTVTVGTGNPFTLGLSYAKNPGPTMYIASARLTYGANLYSQGSFTAPTGPLGIAPTGQTVMLLRNPLYAAMTLKNPLNALSSARVRCLPSDALIYLDAFGSNMPNKAPLANAPTFDPYGTGAVLFRNANSNYLDFGPQFLNVKSKGFTAVVKVQMVLSPANYERFFNLYGPPSSAVYIQFLRLTTTGGFYLAINNGSGEQGIGYPTLLQDVPYILAVRYDAITNTWSFWVNGSVSVSAAGTSTPNDFICLNGFQVGTPGGYPNMNLYTFAAWNRALTDKEITDATSALTQVAPVVPRTIEIGNVNGRPALTVDPTGAVNVLGPLNGAPGGFAPVDLGINSLSLASGNLTSNISVTSFSPFSTGTSVATDGSLYFPGVANTYISFGTTGQPFSNSNIYAFGDFVVEGWVNPNTLTSMAFINGGDPMTGSYWFLGTNSPTGTVAWYSYLNGTPAALNTTATLVAGVWQHVAVIHQSVTKRIQVYINGQPQAISAGGTGFTVSGTVGSYTTGIVPALTNLVIGQNGVSQMFAGYLTNARIVTGSGAAQIYNNNAFVPSTSPLLPASNTAGGSLTTRLLVRVPQAPGQTNVSKIGPASGVLAFPPSPMTAYATNLTGLSPYGQGTYVASASAEFSGSNLAWYAFDKNTGTQWGGQSGQYGSGTFPYLYVGGNPPKTVDVNGNSYTGDWVQLQMPSAIVLSSYSIYYNTSLGCPALFYILGSRDGTNWFLIDQRLQAQPGSSGYITFSVSSSQAFNFLRLQVYGLTTSGGTLNVPELIYNGSMEGLSVTPDGRIGIGSSAPTRSLEVAGDLVVGGTISGGAGMGSFRNRIINGDMRIAQRATTYTYSTSTTGAPSYYCVDRWSIDVFGGGAFSAGSGTIAQVQDAPTGSGFKYSLKFTISSPTTTPNGLYSPFNYRFEGFNTMDFGWGAPSTAVPAVCSFWFKASVAGTYAFSLTTNAGDAGFVTTFQAYNVGTWEYKVVQIVPATFGTFTTDNTCSFSIRIAPQQDSGTGYRTSTLGSWVSSPSYTSTCAGVVNISGTAGAYIQVTGVQLEKGTVATPFEFRPYATELQLCQRYYYQITSPTVAVSGASSQYSIFGVGMNYSTTSGDIVIFYPVAMRTAVPAFSSSAASTFQAVLPSGSATLTAISGGATDSNTPQTARVTYTVASGLVAGNAAWIRSNNLTGSSVAYMAFSCEL